MTPVLALHGFTGDPGAWDAVRGLLGDGVPFLAPALCGHRPGRDDRAVETFGDELGRLRDWLDQRTDHRPLLLGYSLGARVGLAWLAQDPERFVAAVLIGARGGPPAEPAARAERAAADEAWARLLEEEGIEAFAERWRRQPIFASQRDLPAAVRADQGRRRRAHDPRGLARALRVLGLASMPDLGRALPGVRVPVRLLVGARDAPFRTAAEGLASQLPSARVTVVPDCGHNLILEAPPAVAAAVLEELDRCRT